MKTTPQPTITRHRPAVRVDDRDGSLRRHRVLHQPDPILPAPEPWVDDGSHTPPHGDALLSHGRPAEPTGRPAPRRGA